MKFRFSITTLLFIASTIAAGTAFWLQNTRHQRSIDDLETRVSKEKFALQRWLPQSKAVRIASGWEKIRSKDPPNYEAFDAFLKSELFWVIHEGFQLNKVLHGMQDGVEPDEDCAEAIELLGLTSVEAVRAGMIDAFGADTPESFPFLLDVSAQEYAEFESFVSKQLQLSD